MQVANGIDGRHATALGRRLSRCDRSLLKSPICEIFLHELGPLPNIAHRTEFICNTRSVCAIGAIFWMSGGGGGGKVSGVFAGEMCLLSPNLPSGQVSMISMSTCLPRTRERNLGLTVFYTLYTKLKSRNTRDAQ